MDRPNKPGQGIGYKPYKLRTLPDEIKVGQRVKVLSGKQIGKAGKLLGMTDKDMICTVHLDNGEKADFPKGLLGKILNSCT